MVGFLGVNGSGKTTTFLLATGFLTPTQGEILIAGVHPKVDKSWSSQVGVVHSGAGHYARLSVRRNLAFFAELHGSAIDLDVHLARYGLTAFANRPAGQLSKGYQQRLNLARATLHSPKLLLLDEPSDGLDPGATEDLYEDIKRFAAEGGGVLMTSHRVEEVETLCETVVLLDEGLAALTGTVEEVAGPGARGLRGKLLALAENRKASSVP